MLRAHDESWSSTLRAGLVLAAFMALTLPLMPVQAALLRVHPGAARRFPHWYHQRVCRLLGIRLHIEGAVVTDRPVLVIANHTSWLDIPVLSAVAPLSFVAKKEVGSWPFVSWLAKLQQTVFVDRTRKAAVGDTTDEMAARLAKGHALVLFAEGTSTDGNRVLPFMSSLFAAARPMATLEGMPGLAVQTLGIVYTHLHGVPLGRADRPLVGWYGDMAMGSHAWTLLRSGPLDVRIRIGPPVGIEEFADRKSIARRSEAEVRRSVVGLLRARPRDQVIDVAAAPAPVRSGRPGARSGDHRRWT